MRRNEKRKLLKAIEGLNAALKQSLQVAESAVSALSQTKALLQRSEANAELWRNLSKAAQKQPVVVDLAVDQIKPVNGWIN